MSDPVFRTENSTQAGVTDELHAREVEHFALVPFGGAPDIADGGHFGQFALHVILPAWQDDLQYQAYAVGHAPQVIDQLRMRLPCDFGGFLSVRLEVIDAADELQHVEAQIRLVAKVRADLNESVRRNFDPRIDGFQIRAGDLIAEALL